MMRSYSYVDTDQRDATQTSIDLDQAGIIRQTREVAPSVRFSAFYTICLLSLVCLSQTACRSASTEARAPAAAAPAETNAPVELTNRAHANVVGSDRKS